MRYRYIKTDNKIICISSYAGKAVKGIAKCFPTDEYDQETGEKLARKRCDLKIAIKRCKRAKQKCMDAVRNLGDAREYAEKMQSYYDQSFKELFDLKNDLDAFELQLKARS